jgi:ribosome-binding protein aMBF1 (putative translation factor)
MAKTIRTQGHKALIAALIEARRESGLSQTELAQRLKCHQSLVARIESGQSRIDVQELVILARALEADPIEILQNVAEVVPDSERI